MLLEVIRLTKAFGGLVAVKDLEFSVDGGEVVGLIGPNGSGKTTSFHLINGFLQPDQGEIFFAGENITGLKPNKVCHKGIARTFQLTKPFAAMTALQNVMVGRMYGGDPIRSMKHAERECGEILAFVGLNGKESSPALGFSTVERKRLEIARALATKPKMLLLDEMMSGLTHTEMDEALGLVKAIRDSGVTLIVVEHVMKAILEISDRLIVLNYGQKIAEGAPQEVVRNQDVIDAYLGE
ncbi:MAG: ABC transporter ATP-binding protein [Desulfobacteraceae bacterium]